MTGLAEMRLFVTDTLSLDLPPRLVDAWLRQGHRKVQNAAEWPWHYRDAEMTVVQSGSLLAGTVVPQARRLVSVVDPEHGNLREMSWTHAADRFRSSNAASAWPVYWTALEDTSVSSDLLPAIRVRLWPRADTDRENCVVSWLRSVGDWPTASLSADAVPQMPEPFHDLIQTWALNEAYLSEGDTDLARPHYSAFHQQLDSLRDQYIQVSGAEIQVGGDGITGFAE